MNQQDLNSLYEKEASSVYRFFYFKFFDKVTAEDLTSEVFLAFAQKVAQNKRMDDPRRYLYGIVKLVFVRYLRKKYISKMFVRVPVEEFAGRVDIFLEEVDSKPTIEEFALEYIQKLPEKQKMIAQMRFVEKMDLAEICEKLGKDMNYVKTTQKRAIAALKKLAACTP